MNLNTRLVNTQFLNAQLLKTLGVGWLAFLLMGFFISVVFAVPTVAVLIDRSYCPATQWSRVAQTYADLYQLHQSQQLQLQPVIMFSSLDQKVFVQPPTPEVLQGLSTYGRSDPQRQAALQKTYPGAQILNCY